MLTGCPDFWGISDLNQYQGRLRISDIRITHTRLRTNNHLSWGDEPRAERAFVLSAAAEHGLRGTNLKLTLDSTTGYGEYHVALWSQTPEVHTSRRLGTCPGVDGCPTWTGSPPFPHTEGDPEPSQDDVLNRHRDAAGHPLRCPRVQDIQDHAAKWTHAADTLQAAVNTAGELPVWDVKISYCNRNYDVHTCDMNTLLFREFWARALDEDPDHLIMMAPPFKAGDELVDHKTLADQGVTQGSLVIFSRSEVAYGHAIVGAVSGEPLTRSLATNARTAERIAARTWNVNVPCITASYEPGIGYTCIAVPRPIGSIWYTIGEPGATVGNLPTPSYDVRPPRPILALRPL